MVKKYRKRPLTIEAIQWTGDNLKEIIAFTGRHSSTALWTWEEFEEVVRKRGLKIFTPSGPVTLTIGDWVLKGTAGEVYPCKATIFAALYDEESA